MLASIEALQAFDRNLPLRDVTLQQKARRSELLVDAAELVFFFVIQREAMKLPLLDELERLANPANGGTPDEIAAAKRKLERLKGRFVLTAPAPAETMDIFA